MIFTPCKTKGYNKIVWFMPLSQNIKSQKLTNVIYFGSLLWLWGHLAWKQRVSKFTNVFSVSRICMYISFVNFLLSNTKRTRHLKVGYCEMNWPSGISQFLFCSVALRRKLVKKFRDGGIRRAMCPVEFRGRDSFCLFLWIIWNIIITGTLKVRTVSM